MLSVFRRASLHRSCASGLFNVEALEDRRLLSGSISGTVTDDTVYMDMGATHAPLAGVQVFLRPALEGTSQGFASTTTDDAGRYTFGSLAEGYYLVTPVPMPGRFTSTPPVSGGSDDVTVAPDQNVTGKDFGLMSYTVSATQADGKILASRPEDILKNPALLWRITRDGFLDPTFGQAGAVTLQGLAFGRFTPIQIAEKPDGTSVVLSTVAATATSDFLLAVSADGRITNRRDSGGDPYHPELDRIGLTAQGKILEAVFASIYHTDADFTPGLQVLRYNADLTPDATFGSGGVVSYPLLGSPDAVTGLADGSVRVSYYDKTVTLSPSGALQKLVLFKYQHIPTQISLTTSTTHTVMGTPFTLTATVQAAGGPLPVGYTVQFRNRKTVLGTATVDATGNATLVLPRPMSGDYAVTARLLGSHHYLAGTSNSLAVAVDVPQTTGKVGALRVATVTEGTGSGAVLGQTVGIEYNGYLLDGTPVEGNSMTFTLTSPPNIVAGLSQGVLGMKVGETRDLFLPASLGYGSTLRHLIPLHSPLAYVVTLVSIA